MADWGFEMESLSLITTQRQHLFDVGGILVEGIGRQFMRNARKPVVISVRGTFRDGKKIFSDAAAQKLFGIEDAQFKNLYKEQEHFQRGIPLFKGHPGYDEYWQGYSRGQIVEVDFINAAWQSGYSEDDTICRGCDDNRLPLNLIKHRIYQNFLKLRKYGGLSFVHNSDLVADENAAIDIWLERARGTSLGRSPHGPFGLPESLRDIFQARSTETGHWTRLVTITVKDTQLLKSPLFRRALRRLQSHAPVFDGPEV